MRINVYSQELTSEVIPLVKESNTGIVYHAAQLVLHSSPMLHHPPFVKTSLRCIASVLGVPYNSLANDLAEDDDRSAVTFWLPSSQHRREAMALAFEQIAHIFRVSPMSNTHED